MLQQNEEVVFSQTGDMRQTRAADQLSSALDGSYDRSCLGTQSPLPLKDHILRSWSGNARQGASTVLTAREAHDEYRLPFELRVRQRATPSIRDLLQVTKPWPHLPWNLHREAIRILRVEGLASLVRRGGQRAENGLLTFDRASSKVQEIVCRLLGLSAGFWDVDEPGVNWAVCPQPIAPERGPWPAWGVSFDGYQELLEAPIRRSASYQWGDPYGEFHSIHEAGQSEDSIRRRVRNLQLAFDLAGVLVAEANDNGQCIIKLNDNIPSGMGNCTASRDLIGSLTVLCRLPIALFDLLPDCSVGFMKRRSQAVSCFQVLDDQRVLVQISPDLGPTLQQFGNVLPGS